MMAMEQEGHRAWKIQERDWVEGGQKHKPRKRQERGWIV